MECITSDPNTLHCPNFTIQEWEAARIEIIADNPTTNHDGAATILAVGWRAANNEQKRRWAAQQVADQQEEQARTDQQRAEEVKDADDRERGRADAAEDERKKYKQKFIPIPDRPLTADLLVYAIAEEGRARRAVLLHADWHPGRAQEPKADAGGLLHWTRRRR